MTAGVNQGPAGVPMGVPSVASLRAWRVAVVPGDDRDLAMAEALTDAGAEVCVSGPAPKEATGRLQWAPSLEAALEGAQALVLPVAGIDAEGYVTRRPAGHPPARVGPQTLRRLPPGSWVVAPGAPGPLRVQVESLGLRFVDLLEDEPFLLLNAVVTAEGAVQLAMQHLSVTIHASRSVVVGLGRCGQQLARLLSAMGSSVTAVAYGSIEAARAYGLGVRAVAPSQLAQAVAEADVVFNTAPAPVLTEAVLCGMRREALIVDIASGRGGVDGEAARRLGIGLLHALAIPARTAPRTAGRLMARRILELLASPIPGPPLPADRR